MRPLLHTTHSIVKVIQRRYDAPPWVNLSVQKILSRGTGSLPEIKNVGPALWDATGGSEQGVEELVKFAAKSGILTEKDIREMWPSFSATEKVVRGPVSGKIVFLKRPLRVAPPFVRLSENSLGREVVSCTECKCIFICEKGTGVDFVCSGCETVLSVAEFLIGDSSERIL